MILNSTPDKSANIWEIERDVMESWDLKRRHFISKVFASRRGCSACPSSSSCKCRAWTQATLESINNTLLVFQSMALCNAHWVISQFCRLRKIGWIVVFSFRLVSGSCFLTTYICWDVILVAPKEKSRLIPWPAVKATIVEVTKKSITKQLVQSKVYDHKNGPPIGLYTLPAPSQRIVL